VRASTDDSRRCAFLPEDGLIESVPMVSSGDAGLDFFNGLHAAIAIGHDDDAVAFANVGKQMAAESPIASAVTEIPALAFLLDLKANRKRADTGGGNHLTRG